MVVHPAPTSPKVQLANTLAGPLLQPPRTPWGRLFFLIILIGLLTGSGLILGWAWVQRAYPNLTWLHWLPSVSTTTVRERTTENGVTIPSAVLDVAESALGLAAGKQATEIYTTTDPVATLAPLSSSGWLLGRMELMPTEPWVAIPQTGGPQLISTRVTDPASGFVFYKTKNVAQPPVTLANETLTTGLRVWVIQANLRQSIILERRLVATNGPRWLSSDRQEQWWMVDPAVTVPPGSLVVNDRGRLVGLMGAESKLWPADIVESALKQVFQQGTVERPSFGVFAIDRRLINDPEQETASGALVGADDPALAVTVGGPAAQAGLRANDILIEFDQQPLEGDLFHVLRRYRPGETLAITYLRDGVRRAATVELGTLRP